MSKTTTPFRKSSSKNSWFLTLIVVAILFIIIATYNSFSRKRDAAEGFTQNARYTLKRNGDIYDDFYVEVFDVVYQPPTYMDSVIGAIERTTAASDASIFLDVGSKTGKVVDTLREKGYAAYGVEPSTAMVEYSKQYHPSAACQRGDLLDSMLYERGSFSHIICLHNVIYQYKDKVAFLRNCYFWLRSGGTLAIQLTEIPRENLTVGSQKTKLGQRCENGACKPYANQARYPAFNFAASYDVLDHESQETIYTETFIDKSTSNIRENEQMLYMDSTGSILNQASFCRFAIQGKMPLPLAAGMHKGCESFLYFLERMN